MGAFQLPLYKIITEKKMLYRRKTNFLPHMWVDAFRGTDTKGIELERKVVMGPKD